MTARVNGPSPVSAAAAVRSIGKSGMVSGEVVGPAMLPLASICVTAVGSGGKRIARTNARGMYFFTDLRPGVYAVSYADCGHSVGNGYLPQAYSGRDSQHGNHVLVPGGRPTQLSAVTLQPARPQVAIATEHSLLSASKTHNGPFISGIARSQSGKPLSGVCVEASASQSFPGGSFYWYMYTRTNKSGHYGFPRRAEIPAHNYRVLFMIGCGNKGNFAPQWWRRSATGRHATLLNVRAGGTFSHIDARLTRGAIVTGTVRAVKGGAGLPGVCVYGVGRGAMRGVRVPTASRRGGHYVLRGLGTGRFRIKFSPYCGVKGNYLPKSGPTIHVTDGKTVKGIDVGLVLGGQISGTVTSQASGLPVGGICIDFVGETANSFFEAFAMTRADGTFKFGSLEPGQYELAFAGGCGNKGSYAPQVYDGPLSNDGIITIKRGSLVNGVDVAMLPGGTISGRLTVKPDGKAAADPCIVLDSPQGVGALGGNITAFAYFDEPTAVIYLNKAGTYSVPNLTPGTYLAEFDSCSFGPTPYAPQWFSPEGDGAPDWLSVTAGTITSGVNGTLEPGGTISGTITGKGGRPLSQVCVFPQSPSDPFSVLNQLVSGGGFGESAKTGRYSVTGLPAGQYAVEFAPCFFGRYAPQWYKGQGTQASATSVSVTVSHVTAGINAAMTSGGSITGRITSAITGLPVPFACVAALDSSGNVVNVNFAGFGGQYDIPNLGPGTYDVEPSDCLTFLPVLAAVTTPGVQVANGHATSGIDIALPRAGSITGTVTTGNPPVPAANTCIDAIPVTGNGQVEVALPYLDGTYALPGLAPGSYQLLFTNLCVFGSAGLADAQATASVTAGGDTTVNAVVAADGTIAGTVTSASTSTAVGGICVGAFSNATATSPAEVAVTASDGSYELLQLEPGPYIVKFSSGCGASGFATQWWKDAGSVVKAKTVTIDPGASVNSIDASLTAS
ncbi:MAG TPA: carboxypeptidase-like regulatory domain-containing protein [Streptosporangiaceae bacterium]|nr:carboxypeptidase-like regulatory domain-containing protein [Streptosporangiaceae bacterium]